MQDVGDEFFGGGNVQVPIALILFIVIRWRRNGLDVLLVKVLGRLGRGLGKAR